MSDTGLRLFAVADGMGGHVGGEVASRLAVETITTFIRNSASNKDFTWPYGLDDTLSFEGNRLRTAIRLANRRIFDTAESRDDYSGMGTTVAGLLMNGSQLSVGHVGDSRLYLLRLGVLQQLTQDDSWAAMMIAQDPTLRSEEIAHHPMRNVLTNVLGTREQVDVHLSEQTLNSGDVLLLCTDGLHGSLDARALNEILSNTPDVDVAAQKLVDAAIEGGSRDNVTALVVRYENER